MKRFLLAAFLSAAFLLAPIAAHAQLNATYSESTVGLVPASAATDIFTVSSGGSKIIYITKVVVTCTQTTAGTIDLVLVTRSALDTGGSSTSPTIVAHDPNNQGSATATAKAYTANPSVGAIVGNVGTYKLNCPTAAAGAAQDLVLETFGISGDMIVLRPNDVFAVNLNAQTVAGGSFNVRVEHREN